MLGCVSVCGKSFCSVHSMCVYECVCVREGEEDGDQERSWVKEHPSVFSR